MAPAPKVLRRSKSMGDLACKKEDQNFVPQLPARMIGDWSECSLAVHYRELDAAALSAGILDSSAAPKPAGVYQPSTFKRPVNPPSRMAATLPPPARFTNPRGVTHYSSKKPEATAIVSLQVPHKILAVSEELLSLLGFSEPEMCGRSIKIIQGPRTDSGGVAHHASF